MPDDDALPVEECLADLRHALDHHGAAVLAAPTGSGKTTLVPLRLLDEQWLGDGRIVMLEPRRVAARAAARRMAELVGAPVGDTVGYTTRDDRQTSARTRVEVVTEGVLTRRVQSDPTLAGVGLVIFDEFHERSLAADLGLALVLDARAQVRPDLRVLVMSATVDGDQVAMLLGGGAGPVPVVSSDGRLHPVDVRWQPRAPRDHLEPAVLTAVRSALREPGDVLVFLPGVGEITRCMDVLGTELADDPTLDLVPLHGSLPSDAQDRAVGPSPPGRRKVVLATDVAETSITVPGVRTVVDAGLARQPRHDPRTGMTRLVTTAASRASADQRAGRAGRAAPGVAIRLWSKMEHAGRPRFTPAEITQVDLAALVLEVAAWTGAAVDPGALPWLDPPPARTWQEAVAVLTMLGALDDGGRLTPVGRDLVRLPLHPRLGSMVLAAQAAGHGWTACLIAALLDDRDVLRGAPDERPADLTDRLLLLDDHTRRHTLADGRALQAARARARDIARRCGIAEGAADTDAVGRLLLAAYPDRIAARRGSPGKFLLATGTGAWLPTQDPLASADLLVAADLDGHRKEARVRLGAAVAEADLLAVLGDRVTITSTMGWDRSRGDLTVRTERRVGGLRLGATVGRPDPGPEVVAALVDHVRRKGIGAGLSWTPAARALQARVAFLATHRHGWPDLSDEALVARLDDWLGPYLTRATGIADVAALDVEMALAADLDWDRQMTLADLAPTELTLPTGRRLAVAYGPTGPTAAVRVQHLFGCRSHPTVLEGTVPVVLHLLSPADRPIQVTSDLAGFWSGSWLEVRKAMAGRYPKHPWPADPHT